MQSIFPMPLRLPVLPQGPTILFLTISFDYDGPHPNGILVNPEPYRIRGLCGYIYVGSKVLPDITFTTFIKAHPSDVN